MSQKSSVPQDVSFVSQVLKRDTPEASSLAYSGRMFSGSQTIIRGFCQKILWPEAINDSEQRLTEQVQRDIGAEKHGRVCHYCHSRR